MPMHYLSIDIETTGLDFRQNQIVEFAAISTYIGQDMKSITPRQIFHRYIKSDSGMYNMQIWPAIHHTTIFQNIERFKDDRTRCVLASELSNAFHEFLIDLPDYTPDPQKRYQSYNVAGKNFNGFDKIFLENQIPNWSNTFKFNYRVMDPSLFYFKPDVDTRIPSLEECCVRAEFKPTSFHNALDDAFSIIALINNYFRPVQKDIPIQDH